MSQLDELVQRCKQGDLAAFTRLFSDHEARLYRLAVTILHNEADAEGALQDTYIRIFERIGRFREQSSLETWMTAIMVNVCRDRLRRRKVRRALPLDWLRGQAGGGPARAWSGRRRLRESEPPRGGIPGLPPIPLRP